MLARLNMTPESCSTWLSYGRQSMRPSPGHGLEVNNEALLPVLVSAGHAGHRHLDSVPTTTTTITSTTATAATATQFQFQSRPAALTAEAGRGCAVQMSATMSRPGSSAGSPPRLGRSSWERRRAAKHQQGIVQHVAQWDRWDREGRRGVRRREWTAQWRPCVGRVQRLFQKAGLGLRSRLHNFN